MAQDESSLYYSFLLGFSLAKKFQFEGTLSDGRLARRTANGWVSDSIPATGLDGLRLMLDSCFIQCHIEMPTA